MFYNRLLKTGILIDTKEKRQSTSKDNHPNKLYYVLKGKINVYKRNEDGKEFGDGSL
jgi:CRP-like cAMP-binding protein